MKVPLRNGKRDSVVRDGRNGRATVRSTAQGENVILAGEISTLNRSHHTTTHL